MQKKESDSHMPAERYYFDQSLSSETIIELRGTEFHHLTHVMRTKKGDYVEIVNGKGELASGHVEILMRDKALLKIKKVEKEEKKSLSLTLAQALVKPNRLEFLLEKGTELGVESFYFFPGEHSSNKNCYPSHLERMRTITIAAMKQCGRLFLPTIQLLPPISQWCLNDDKIVFFGDLNRQAHHFEETWKNLHLTSKNQIMFVTGPEGGFSENEMIALKKMRAHGVQLHPHILRAETASIMAISLLSHWIFT